MRACRSLLTILACCFLLPMAVHAQEDEEMEPVFPPPAPPQSSFALAQAYPCLPQSYPPELGIADLRCYRGAAAAGPPAPGAVPGVLSLPRRGLELDVNCFAIPPANARGPCRVQFYQLAKTVPGRTTILQFGRQVRTWWSLNFTPPGTRFTLIVHSVCPVTGPRRLLFKQDVFSWVVIANPQTMLRLIDLMHTGAVGTSELPCILAEDTYDLLVELVQQIDQELMVYEFNATAGNLLRLQNTIIELTQFLLINCLMIDIAEPVYVFPGPEQFGEPDYQPPGNLAGVTLAGETGGFAGIIDTIEHPCCSILLADLIWIAFDAGLSLNIRLPRLEE
jgi:hypothetical protein